MSTVWIVSLVLAWVVIAVLVLVVVSLLRQVAELRAGGAIAPPVAASGPAPYDAVAPADLQLLHDGGLSLPPTLVLGGDQRRPMLLVVHAPGCASCELVEDWLEALADEGPAATVVSVLGLREDAAREHLAVRSLRGVPTVGWDSLPDALRPDTTPALVAVAREGLIAAVGHPAALEHLREAAAIADGAVLIGAPDSIRSTVWGSAVPAWGVNDTLDIVHVEGGTHEH